MKDFRAHGFTCKLLACALRTETGVAAYVEPALVAEGEPEAAVPGNYNLISCTGELLGRQSYFGQGAGRYPTAANVVQDCLDLLAGEDGFYTETARPMAVEADAVAHPYYVRTRTADPWLESVTADRWDSGVITGAVPVGQMRAGRRPSGSGIPDALWRASGDGFSMFTENFIACSNKRKASVV